MQINGVEQLLNKWVRNNAPGLTMAVVQNGEVILQRDYGLANLDYGVPITARTVFRVASLAKQFTAACIGLLEEDGVLSLNSDIRTWIPELPRYPAPITLEHLLWHTSGLRDFPHLLWGLSGRSFGDAVTQEGVLDMLSRLTETDFPAGTRHLYCNTGYFLLGAAVARITGQSLAQFAQDRIFTPLGMTNTHFQDDYTRVISNRATGYTSKDGGYAVSDSPTTTLVGDDGLFTTLEDMLIWEQNFYADKLGQGGLVQRMLQRGRLQDGTPVDYGYGLFLTRRRGLDLFWHYGEYLGFRSVIRSFPQLGWSLICLANTSELDPIDFALEVEDLCLDADFCTAKPHPHKPTPVQRTLDLSKYVGLYCNREEGFTIETKLGASGLDMFINGRSSFALTMMEGNKADAGLDFPLGLEFQSDGRAAGFFDGDAVFPLEALSVRPHPPTYQELAQLAGEYYNSALDTSWIAVVDGGELRLVNRDRHRISPQEPLVHIFEDFYIAWFNLWRRKICFRREGEEPASMVVLNGESGSVTFLKVN